MLRLPLGALLNNARNNSIGSENTSIYRLTPKRIASKKKEIEAVRFYNSNAK